MKTISVKLLVNKISTDLTSVLTYVHEYNLKHGVTVNFEIAYTSVSGYQSSYVQVRPGVWYWILATNPVPLQAGHDVTIFMFNQGEWSTPPGSQYPLLPSTPTSDCILVGGKPFVNLGFYAQDLQGSQVTFCHELMHAYDKIANASGFPTVDQMDTYYLNSNPDAPAGNFSIQWNNLQHWLNSNQPKTMKATLTRNSDDGVETLGTLVVTKPDGSTWSCSTLERPWLNNAHNVSCIPKGTYHCVWSPFYQAFNYELQNVPGRNGIFIHVANFYTDLEGCIGLGVKPADINHDGQVDITSSTATLSTFVEMMGQQPFDITIL